jgi:hypothetical protein
MSFPLSVAKIAAITGAHLDNVTVSWPAIEAALLKHGAYSDNVAIAAIATIRVECPPFIPIHEYGNELYFQRAYEGRHDLGNDQVGDGVKFAGRGFIQLTGRNNYRNYGKLLGIDLEADPDRALVPAVAAEIFALYFKGHRCVEHANAGEWVRVRELVNGGHNGLEPFLALVNKLKQSMPAVIAPPANGQKASA